MYSKVLCVVLLLFGFFAPPEKVRIAHKRFLIEGRAQGTTYRIVYFSTEEKVKKAPVDVLLNQIDSSLSLYKPYSLINRFNSTASGIVADTHFKTVVDKAMQTFEETNGLFDISVYPLMKIWGFGPHAAKALPPSDSIILAARKLVNTRQLYWKEDSLLKTHPGVEIDANGIAQGYAVDMVAQYLEERGVGRYLVEIGGEIRINGRKENNEKMSVGIESPATEDSFFPVIDKIIYLDKGAVTTSGNYRQFYEDGNKKRSHIISPRTGHPVENEMISVTLIAPDALTADAYDNALMLMGVKEALSFVEERQGWEAYLIYLQDNGKVADTMTTGFRKYLTKEPV